MITIDQYPEGLVDGIMLPFMEGVVGRSRRRTGSESLENFHSKLSQVTTNLLLFKNLNQFPNFRNSYAKNMAKHFLQHFSPSQMKF